MSDVQMKMDSKIGPLFLVASKKGLVGVFWSKQKTAMAEVGTKEFKIIKAAEKEINEYFLGKRKIFSIALDVKGTDFQKRVWERLAQIPYGETRSYKDLARELNDENASRAVGTANGRNPLSIILPCHRVIATSGALAGYAGGIHRKRKLLELEGKVFLEKS